MQLIGKFIFVAILGLFLNQALACEDGVLYKQCQDQLPIFSEALKTAQNNNKHLVITLGYESCPWCQSLGKMFNDFHSQQSEIDSQFDFVEIAAYSYDRFSKSFDEVISGTAVAELLLRRLESVGAINGYPVMFVVNPQNGKAALIDTGKLEENDEANGIYGHSRQKVMDALYGARSALSSVL